MKPPPWRVGIDVGSTTIKVVALSADGEIRWKRYERHEGAQAARLLRLLEHLEQAHAISPANAAVFITGSGGSSLAAHVGARFIQEVTAVSLAVERLHEDVHAVVELGGQDAKILVFNDDPSTGRRSRFSSMNDKCAGGTGAVIDKIGAKLGLSAEQIAACGYTGIRVHPVAGKCGVFAETDINGLQKQGIPADELMASLFDAIVLQNLTVLTRGHTLMPVVLLLGGPTTFIPGLREAWQAGLAAMWEERSVALPDDADPAALVRAPANAEYYAALGAAEFGRDDDEVSVRYAGTAALAAHLRQPTLAGRFLNASAGLARSDAEVEAFRTRFAPEPFAPVQLSPGQRVRGFIGIDGGSTTTKGVVLGEDASVLCKVYTLSNGNPIADTVVVMDGLRTHIEGQGATLDVLGVGTTGYAKDLLKGVLDADVALVETVAHTHSALQVLEAPDVIVDVGGQDIKLMFLRDGRVIDFRLNTQCSAGNGYFLHATAQSFGIPLEGYADAAFRARTMPVFGYGCAVFLQSDIVNFQRLGWSPEQILAGLAAVLPKNIWLYVARMPNLARLGSRFLLQGGTQNNLAAVKAQVDFIRERFAGTGIEPEIRVHPHCGEAGAIGAALESRRLWQEGRATTFVGLDAVKEISYRTTRGEETRCRFCRNTCLRTFIDVRLAGEQVVAPPAASKVPLLPGERRLILATCEKGAAEDVERMRQIKAELDAVKRSCPDLTDIAGRTVWAARHPASVADPVPARGWRRATAARIALMHNRERFVVGIPRVQYLYWYAPLFSGYLESLGVAPDNIVYSDFTSEELYRSGARRGSIDPCFPSKVAVAHVHNLVYVKHPKRRLDCIFSPMFDYLRSPLANLHAPNACPTATATPQTVRAAFTGESDVFAEHGITFLAPLVDLWRPQVLAGQLFEAWSPLLGLSRAENGRAVAAGLSAQGEFEQGLRRRAREMLDALEHEGRLGIVLIGRPYHHDPGINHGILEQLQKLGYAIFSQSALPLDPDLLDRLFGDEVRSGVTADPLDITDVWKHTSSAATCHKIWAAKFVARHPNLVALELSSFKCGHDAPVYAVLERIVEQAGTPYFSFRDVDENRPAGAIRIRVETIDYFLRRYWAARNSAPGRPGFHTPVPK